MKIKFLGAAKTVTGSFYVIDTDKVRFAVDCGLFQGTRELKEKNYADFSVDPKSIEFLVLTHAHIDHSGLTPKLCKSGFAGPIYCSPPTKELCQVMFPDAGHIQESEVERKNRKLIRAGKKTLEPIYTVEDAVQCLPQLRPLNYDEVIRLAPGVEIRLRDAGHILGSSIIELWVEENGEKVKVVFSGDLGQPKQPIIKDPTIIEDADYLLMESTYGDRNHKEVSNRAEQLKKVIDDTMKRGGNLVIPSFAVERTQDLLYDLSILQAQGQLDPSIDIYIDSPLAIAATEIFKKSTAYYDQETMRMVNSGHHPLMLPNLKYSRTQQDSMEINKIQKNAIIISASGMCDAGRIKYHLKYNLWRPECTILFVGYQAVGTLGRRILEGEKLVNIHSEKVAVKANIQNIDAYSAHADQNGLMSWLKNFNKGLKTLFLVHGEEKSQQVLADLIRKELGLHVVIPNLLDEIELKPVEVVQPVQVISGVHESQSEKLNKALAAEELYLKIRSRLNGLYQESYNNEQYDELIEKLKKLETEL
ncbi:MAG: MBL fold metallo-hydrolase [Syntrophomonas sp.]|nr:MBL fold metallo-hydrolase [Syntrophomonas sp.]